MQPVPTQQPPPAWEEELHPRENYEVTLQLNSGFVKLIPLILMKLPLIWRFSGYTGLNGQLTVSVLRVFVLNFLADSSKLCRADGGGET